MQIEIPEAVVHALRLPESETEERLRTELAAALYGRGILPFGRARELAGLDRLSFAQVLRARGMSRHYTSEELSDDVAYARRQ
jgi:predicted HTH domain antitoxin